MGMTENGRAGAPTVPTGPVATIVGVIPFVDQKVVGLMVSTPIGQSWYFVSPDAAEGIAANLVTAAGRARSGLVVPTGDVPPPPTGN